MRFNMFSLLVLLFSGLCCRFGHGQSAPIQFLAQKWYRDGRSIKFASRDDPLIVSCQTSSPNANVRLLKADDYKRGWLDAVYYSNGGIAKVGQAFLFQKLTLGNAGYYKCTADYGSDDKRELEKGKLIINPVKRKEYLEIFPNDPVLRVNPNDNVTLVCKTYGQRGTYNSYITWYRRNSDGRLVKVNGRVYRSDEYVSGRHIDVEKLQLTGFSEKDAGTYVCVRRVYGSTQTEKDIRIEINRAVFYENDAAEPLFSFDTKEWSSSGRVPLRLAMLRQFFFISCQTNDPSAAVSLLQTQDKSSSWRKAPTRGRVIQIGQTFMIRGVSLRDTSFYKCRAIGTYGQMIELEKGFLVVVPVQAEQTPEIFPNRPNLRVRRNADMIISCKGIGVAGTDNSFLTWYRRYGSSYIYVDSKKIRRLKQIIGRNHVDVEEIIFKNFQNSDEGEYICVRQVPSSKPKTASITIEMA